MEKEYQTQISASAVPSNLKYALADYFRVFEQVKASLPEATQRYLGHWLSGLLQEAIDPEIPFHWWEVALDLIEKDLLTTGETGFPLIEAGRKLANVMRAHLGPYDEVRLGEITEETVRTVCKLTDTLVEPQKYMVAPNAVSLAQALFSKHAWYRAIYAGKALVGFLMLYEDESKPEYFLWRFMIASPYQGRGYGAGAIRRLVEYVRTRPNARELSTSCELGPGSPKAFYIKQGFISTGEFLDDELVLKMSLD